MAGKEVWLVDVEQIAFVSRELVVKLVAVLWEESLVETDVFVDFVDKVVGTAAAVQSVVRLTVVQPYGKLKLQDFCVAAKNFMRDVNLEEINFLALVSIQKQPFGQQIPLEDLPLYLLTVVFVCKDKVNRLAIEPNLELITVSIDSWHETAFRFTFFTLSFLC